MSNKLSLAPFFLIIVPLFPACRGPVKESKIDLPASSVSAGQKYLVDTGQSVVTWKGSMLLAPDKEHVGYVHISKGELMIDKDRLTGGSIEIDMNTIEYKDKEDRNTPVQHLKSPDYFDVEKFPVSTIAITRVESVSDTDIKITGNLTIKGVTRPVTFPAKIEVKDGTVKADGQMTIDRTDWGIRYRSGKFYDVIADEIVSDDIGFVMKIVARK